MSQSKKLGTRKILNYIIHYFLLILAAIFTLFPFFWMFLTSVKPDEQIYVSPPVWIPKALNLKNYIEVWNVVPLARYMRNTLIVSLGATLVGVILACFGGYSLSRFRYKGKSSLITLLLFTQMIPFALTIVPFYLLMLKIGLHNTYTGLIFAYAIWAVPFCTLLLRSYFKSAYPLEIEESAVIDGCSKWGVFTRIAIPLSFPGIIATAIFCFLLAWNEFMWASIILSKKEYRTLSLGLRDFIAQHGTIAHVGLYMVGAIVAVIPALVISGFILKHLVTGLSAGAVKG
jgi:multiple sugar transport system permease protein